MDHLRHELRCIAELADQAVATATQQFSHGPLAAEDPEHLNDLTARDLMVSRVATPSLSGAASLDSVRQEILDAPDDAWWVVLGEEVDEVLGVQSRERAMAELLSGGGYRLISQLCDAPQFVPEMIHADRLLTSFRRGDRSSVRVVVDEFGAFVGLVSAADILGVLAGWKRVPSEG